jgi:glycosyltransferase involved in cell wall biosynthesis
MTSQPPSISVVLSTYNRAALLDGAIRSLLAQDPEWPPHEILVVDNNSRDDTRAVVESLIPTSDGRLRYLFEAAQGLSHARNRGIVESRGSIVAFTDDDVRADPHWLTAVARAFAEHPEASFVGGRVLPLYPSPPPAWLTPANWGPLALLDYGDAAFRIDASRVRCLVGANMAYRREVFDRFGGFDPNHQHVPGATSAVEDHEFELRLFEAGLTAWYDPRIVIHADVQANRLTRAYHRKWHLDHGFAVTRMLPPGAHFDAAGRVRPLPPQAKRLFRVPLHVFGELARAAVGVVRHTVLGSQDRAIHSLGEIYECIGAMRCFSQSARATRDPGAAAPPLPLRAAQPGTHDPAPEAQSGVAAASQASLGEAHMLRSLPEPERR